MTCPQEIDAELCICHAALSRRHAFAKEYRTLSGGVPHWFLKPKSNTH
jgi:hypothetical protein